MSPANMFTVIAHRGDSSSRPENTFEAFDHAVQQGFHHIETDCQLSKDGRCIVLHDEKLGRTNNGSGLAWDCDHHELLQLDAGVTQNTPFLTCATDESA
jgi:glycerophosphoryl diester phosphodiesterase